MFFERELSLFMNFKRETVPLFHLGPIQLELRHGSSAGVVIPPVGEQNATDIHKYARDCRGFPGHVFSVLYGRGQFTFRPNCVVRNVKKPSKARTPALGKYF
jgi:hypothetical protein